MFCQYFICNNFKLQKGVDSLKTPKKKNWKNLQQHGDSNSKGQKMMMVKHEMLNYDFFVQHDNLTKYKMQL